jgi:hypothetical protein
MGHENSDRSLFVWNTEDVSEAIADGFQTYPKCFKVKKYSIEPDAKSYLRLDVLINNLPLCPILLVLRR